MEELIIMFQEHFYKLLITGFFTFISWVAKKFLNEYKKSQELKMKQAELETNEQKDIKLGLVALLRKEINEILTGAEERGFFYIDERASLDDLYKNYRKLGGNSGTKTRYDVDVEQFQVKARLIHKNNEN